MFSKTRTPEIARAHTHPQPGAKYRPRKQRSRRSERFSASLVDSRTKKMEFYILFALYPRRSLPDDASAKLVRKRRSKWKKFLMSLPNGIKSVVSRNHYYRSMTFPTTDDDSGGHLAPASLKEKSTNTRSSPDLQTAKEQRNERKIETSCRRPTPTKIFRVLFYFYIPHTPRNR